MLSVLGAITLIVIIGVVILVVAKKRKASGLLGRAANLAEGKADRAMEELEKEDPEAIFRTAIKEYEQELVDLNQASKEIKGLQFEEVEKADNLKKEKAQLQTMLDVAVEQEEELGAEILEKMESIDEQIKDHETQAKEYEIQGEDMVKMRNDKKKELDKLRVEMKQTKSTSRAAEIVGKARDRANGMTNDAISKGLESARAKTAESKAALKADKDIQENSIENRMAKLYLRPIV